MSFSPRSNAFLSLLLMLTAPLFGFSFITKSSTGAAISSRPTAVARPMGLFGGDSDILKGVFGGSSNNDGPKVVLDIPVENVKAKPLRFFLQIYIVGDQNSQDSQSWLPREAEEGFGIQVYYKDGTGMCQIGFENDSIKILRHGQRPSLEYLLQESVMLHGVLDELNNIAFEVEDVEESKRLLKMDKDALDKARESLPARQA